MLSNLPVYQLLKYKILPSLCMPFWALRDRDNQTNQREYESDPRSYENYLNSSEK